MFSKTLLVAMNNSICISIMISEKHNSNAICENIVNLVWKKNNYLSVLETDRTAGSRRKELWDRINEQYRHAKMWFLLQSVSHKRKCRIWAIRSFINSYSVWMQISWTTVAPSSNSNCTFGYSITLHLWF